jgi:hypothetical protein
MRAMSGLEDLDVNPSLLEDVLTSVDAQPSVVGVGRAAES